MAGKPVIGLFQSADWLDYDDYETSYLKQDDAKALVAADAFDVCSVFVNIEVETPEGTDSKELAAAITAFEKRVRPWVRKLAGKEFTTIAEACRALQGEGVDPGASADGQIKAARDAAKSLEDQLEKFVFKELGGELRRHVAKWLGVEATSLATLNESKVNVRLNPDRFGFDISLGGADKDKLDDAFETLADRKSQWLDCCIIWEKLDELFVVLGKPRERVRNDSLTKARKAYGFKGQGKINRGVSIREGKEWTFQFNETMGLKEIKLKEALERQLDDKGIKVSFEIRDEFVFPFGKNLSSHGDAEEDEDEDEEDEDSSKSKTKSVGGKKLARPLGKR